MERRRECRIVGFAPFSLCLIMVLLHFDVKTKESREVAASLCWSVLVACDEWAEHFSLGKHKAMNFPVSCIWMDSDMWSEFSECYTNI